MISIVICSVDAAKFAAVQRSYAQCMADEPFEVVGIHDAHSLCEGYNRGLARASGDLCVFSHDDVDILSRDLGATLRRHLKNVDVVGVAGTVRLAGMGWAESGIAHARGVVAHTIDGGYVIRLFGALEPVMPGIEALDGVFIATRREVAADVGFDEITFDGWHGYDTDFTFRCHRAGYRLAVCTNIRLVHFSNANVDAAWLEYDRRFAAKHEAHLTGEHGRWLDVCKRVRTREEIIAAYDPAELRAVSEEIARRVPASETAR